MERGVERGVERSREMEFRKISGGYMFNGHGGPRRCLILKIDDLDDDDDSLLVCDLIRS
jgi:hypothetical protein